jgi:hypothetical protein
MVLGPTMRDAINMGYLVGYRVAMPETDIDIARVRVSETTGDFIQRELADAFHKSATICGDIVKAYRRYLDGKRAVVFAVDVEEAGRIARTFKEAGIPAEAVQRRNRRRGPRQRARPVRGRRNARPGQCRPVRGGFDLPTIDGVIMARHTESFSLYAQQWGRGARLDIPAEWAERWDEYSDEQRRHMIGLSPKPHMWLIDMVGNVERHNGPPDFRTSWSLDARSSRTLRRLGRDPHAGVPQQGRGRHRRGLRQSLRAGVPLLPVLRPLPGAARAHRAGHGRRRRPRAGAVRAGGLARAHRGNRQAGRPGGGRTRRGGHEPSGAATSRARGRKKNSASPWNGGPASRWPAAGPSCPSSTAAFISRSAPTRPRPKRSAPGRPRTCGSRFATHLAPLGIDATATPL